MDDDIFRRFFGTNQNDPFSFHNDFRQMFDEIDQMMSRFNHSNFNMIDSK